MYQHYSVKTFCVAYLCATYFSYIVNGPNFLNISQLSFLSDCLVTLVAPARTTLMVTLTSMYASQ